MGAMEIQKELVFAEEEYRSRVKAVQKQLEEKGMDAFLVFQIHSCIISQATQRSAC